MRITRRLALATALLGSLALASCGGGSGGDSGGGASGGTATTLTPTSLQITGAPTTLVEGDTFTLSAVVRDQNGAVMSGVTVTWTTTTPTRLTAGTAGQFTVVGSGTATVTAQAGTASASWSMDAEARRLTSLSLSVSGPIFIVGDQELVAVAALDQRQRSMTASGLSWSASDTSRMSVSSAGLLQAIGQGDVTITASQAATSVSATLQVRVLQGDGPRVAALTRLDSAVVAWMDANRVPGAQLAVMRDGRLVLARAYGVRDRATGASTRLNNLFRIGSVSKPIAGFAFLQLVDRGVVSLNDLPFATLSNSYTPLPGESIDARLLTATARDVLRHQTGYADRDVDNRVWQGVWQFGARSPAQHFRYGLGFPLDQAPALGHTYTNFNTQALARFIEIKTGRGYEQHVQEALLAPAGITRMQYGKDLLADRHVDEVRHHDANGNVSAAIDNDPNAMAYYDASGSWIANATDLLRLMRNVEGLAGTARLVSAASIAEITTTNATVTPPSSTSFYGLHWQVQRLGTGFTWSHTGAAVGSWAQLVRQVDGITIALLANRDFAGLPYLDLSTAMAGVRWPTNDLFDQVP